MAGVVGLVVIGLVAPNAGIRSSVGVIAVMAIITICNGGMCTCQGPVIVVRRHGGRCPARIRCMTGFTGSGNACSCVVGVVGLIIVIYMAGRTNCWCTRIPACMT